MTNPDLVRWNVPAMSLNTRRGQFLLEADRLFPWAGWIILIDPHYPKRGNGRPPYPLGPLLRLSLFQQWFDLSDLATQEAATDSVAVRGFMGLPLTWDQKAPDETTILNFRRLLARTGLAKSIASDAAACLAKHGWKIRQGVIIEAGFLANKNLPVTPIDVARDVARQS